MPTLIGLYCKWLLDPEHVETTGEAVVPAEREEHAVAAACTEVEACSACKATLAVAASMAANISGVEERQ